jgi:ribokinase
MDDIFFRATNELIPNNLGGASIYSACGAALWGSRTHIVSIVGDGYHLGKLEDICKNANIDTSSVIKIPGNGIELIIEYDSLGEHEFIPKMNSGNYYDFAPKAHDISDALISSNSVFHITPIPIEIQISIATKLKEYTKLITLDPDIIDVKKSKYHMWHELFMQIDYFLLSQKELRAFKHEFYKDQSVENILDLDFLLKFKADFRIKNLVFKAGAKGSYLLGENNQIIHVPVCSVDPKDLTGAGDSFAGGFGVALDRNEGALAGMYYGTVSASFAIEDYGFAHILEAEKPVIYSRLDLLKGGRKK